MSISIFWFRRDLRLEDNTGLHHALESGDPVLPIFIFDRNILDELPEDDARVSFIHSRLKLINETLSKHNSSLLVLHGKPIEVLKDLISKYDVSAVFTNRDYEPYGIKRDKEVSVLLDKKQIQFNTFKDQVIYEKNDILKSDETPYTIYTPYKNQWLGHFNKADHQPIDSSQFDNCYQETHPFPSLSEIGFKQSSISVRDFDISNLDNYGSTRNFPAADTTSYLSPHLRFGTISVRQVISRLKQSDEVFLSELIWREFFMQILFHFPQVVDHNFKRKYDGIKWRNNEDEFEAWCQGMTGYPMVDAGMRQLNTTGFMHNRVRMVVASFLCKHLLTDWKWGESYFAEKLLDYELSSNNGNWQWAAGTGCDAAPYFRIFNPTTQLKKFDKDLTFVNKYVPEYGTDDYPEPIVEHKFARERALNAYKAGIDKSS